MIRVLFFDLDETLAAQEQAFLRAYRATAEWLALEVADLDAASFAERIPIAAERALCASPIATTLQRCRFGGRDLLWGNPGTDSDPASRISEGVTAVREACWSSLLEDVSGVRASLVAQLGLRFRAAMFSAIEVFADVPSSLERLARRYRLAVITNGMGAAQREKLAFLGLDGFFERLVASTDVGQGKPSSEIFEAALQAMDVRACDALMVGDSLEGDVEGARAAGIAALWLCRASTSSSGVPHPSIASLAGWWPDGACQRASRPKAAASSW